MTVKLPLNLPHLAYSAQQVKQQESVVAQVENIPMYQLMQNAANAVFKQLCRLYSDAKSICIVAGGGNNAGDGYLVGKYALLAGIDVVVMALKSGDELTGDAERAYREFIAAGGDVEQFDKAKLNDCSVIIDALLGIGFSGALSKPYQGVISTINDCDKPVISVDLPSGLNATTGEVSVPTVNAAHTVTFIALKQGLLSGRAKHCVGKLHFVGLGLGDAFLKQVPSSVSHWGLSEQMAQLPSRQLDGYKNKYGHVLLIGGNQGMAGAIRLAGEACLRAGAGLVSVLTHHSHVSSVIAGRYEMMVHGYRAINQCSDETDTKKAQDLIEKADVIVIGPGLGQDDWANELLALLEKVDKPIVMDADALTLLARTPRSFNQLVITPHPAEAARLLQKLTNEIELNRFDSVKQLSQKYHCISVLKGPGTLISDGVNININRSGCVAMASAGMGDVLSGIIGALIGQGMSLYHATSLAVYIHGLAAEEAAQAGTRGLLASDLFPYIRKLVE